MTKKTIAVDIDDVIADTSDMLRQKANVASGIELTREHFQAPGEYWGYYERVWQAHGVKVDLKDMEADMAIDQAHVPILAGASFALGELSREYDLVIITSRWPKFEEATKRWLEQNFKGIIKDLCFAKGYPGSEGDTKGELCVKLGAEYLIDDHTGHCLSALECGIQPILFGDYGWQKPLPDSLIPFQCRDWQAVLDYFNGLTGKG